MTGNWLEKILLVSRMFSGGFRYLCQGLGEPVYKGYYCPHWNGCWGWISAVALTNAMVELRAFQRIVQVSVFLKNWTLSILILFDLHTELTICPLNFLCNLLLPLIFSHDFNYLQVWPINFFNYMYGCPINYPCILNQWLEIDSDVTVVLGELQKVETQQVQLRWVK